MKSNEENVMEIFLTGVNGFVGAHLASYLLDKGYRVTGVDIAGLSPMRGRRNFTYLAADTTRSGEWQDQAARAEVVVNLAGKNIFTYWTPSIREEILNSRIETTRRLVESFSGGHSPTLINASAAGYYGNRKDEILDEEQPPGRGYLSEVSSQWEKEAQKAEDRGARVVITRFGVVLYQGGGALRLMRPFFRAFLGGRLGNGKQWFPWIHLQDLMRGIVFVIENETITGPLNFCAPHPVTNREFTRAMGKAVQRPAPFVVPAFVLKLSLGKLGEALLQSQKAVPEKLNEHDFTFEYPYIQTALDRIMASWPTEKRGSAD